MSQALLNTLRNFSGLFPSLQTPCLESALSPSHLPSSAPLSLLGGQRMCAPLRVLRHPKPATNSTLHLLPPTSCPAMQGPECLSCLWHTLSSCQPAALVLMQSPSSDPSMDWHHSLAPCSRSSPSGTYLCARLPSPTALQVTGCQAAVSLSLSLQVPGRAFNVIDPQGSLC